MRSFSFLPGPLLDENWGRLTFVMSFTLFRTVDRFLTKISKILTSSALFKDLKGVGLVTYCLMKLKNKLVLGVQENQSFTYVTSRN